MQYVKTVQFALTQYVSKVFIYCIDKGELKKLMTYIVKFNKNSVKSNFTTFPT